MKTLSSATPLILASLCHSDCELQGICIDQTPSQMIQFSRVSYYISTRHQLWSFAWCFSRDKDFICLVKPTPTCKFYSCSLRLCRYFQIFFFFFSLCSPCTGNLGNQQVNEFWKTPSWQVTIYSRKIFITVIIIKHYAANAVQNGLFVGCLV